MGAWGDSGLWLSYTFITDGVFQFGYRGIQAGWTELWDMDSEAGILDTSGLGMERERE